MSTEEVLDPAVISGLRRARDAFGNPEFIRQLAALFLANTPVKMDRVRKAISDGDTTAIREVAHALRSTCGMLGATRMADACARLEDAAVRTDLAVAVEAFREADEQLPLVLTALATLE